MSYLRNRRMAITLCRIAVGAVFLFSGLSKGFDAWGTALKTGEYLTAFGMETLMPASGALAVLQCTVETALGLLLLTGRAMRVTGAIASIAMAFFTLLTLIIAIWNPLDDCGCFGATLKISNWATFAKNVILLPLAIVAWKGAACRKPVISRSDAAWATLFVAAGLLPSLYSLSYLPIVDTSPYRRGTDLRTEVLCTGCTSRSTTLIYEDMTNGGTRTFSLSDTTWYDASRWRYVATRTIYDDLPAKAREYDLAIWQDGYNIAESVLFAEGTTYLLMVRDATDTDGRILSRLESFAASADPDIRMLRIAGAEGEDAAADGSVPEGYDCLMDRTLMAQMLRADAGVIEICDGIIVSKTPWRRL